MNIAIFRPGTLGDLLTTKPLLDYLFKKYNKKILVISENNKNKTIINGIKDIIQSIDDFATYDSNSKRIILFFNLISLIKKNRLSIIYIVPPRGKGVVGALIHRISFVFIGLFSNCKIIYPKINIFNLFSKITNYNEFERISLYYPQISYEKLLINESQANNKRVVIFYGAKFSSKIWPNNYYIELIIKIIKDYNYSIDFFCVKKDFDIIKLIYENDFGPRFNLHIDMNLNLITDYLTNAKIIICCDTGTMHLSALYNQNLICIFSDRDQDNWLPIRSLAILRNRVTCGGCMLDVCNKDTHLCLESITPQLVLSYL